MASVSNVSFPETDAFNFKNNNWLSQKVVFPLEWVKNNYEILLYIYEIFKFGTAIN